jgi:hypothetical protein
MICVFRGADRTRRAKDGLNGGRLVLADVSFQAPRYRANDWGPHAAVMIAAANVTIRPLIIGS